MLAIGRALMARPKLLLLDEPSMGLAPILVERIFEIIREINAQGTTILLVEQNALMALDVANRGYVLETGHRRARGRREGAPRERASAQDLPRRGVVHPHGEVRRCEQHAQPTAAAASRHLEGRTEAVRRDEPELAGGDASRQPATSTAPSRASAGWHAAPVRRTAGADGTRGPRGRRRALAGRPRQRAPPRGGRPDRARSGSSGRRPGTAAASGARTQG